MFCSAAAQSQTISPQHEVRKGDTLFAVARMSKYDSVTRNQMIIAIYRANSEVFPGGDPNRLAIGSILRIPARETVEAIGRAEADQLVRDLIARPIAALPPPTARPVPTPERAPKPEVPAAAPLNRADAAKRYRDGLAYERRGDDKRALRAFLDAGENGHGLAQRRLGEIYDRGNAAVERDYETSLKWYQKAREQGVELPKPIQRGPLH